MRTTITKEPTREKLLAAVELLASHHRGRNILRALQLLISDAGADGLDMFGQRAVLDLLACQFGPFAGSTRHEIARSLGADEADATTFIHRSASGLVERYSLPALLDAIADDADERFWGGAARDVRAVAQTIRECATDPSAL